MAVALRLPAHAQTVSGYTITLTVSPDGAEVRAGATLTYMIKATEPASPPSALGVVYRFITPQGTTFVSARAVRGAKVFITPTAAAKGTNPVGQGGVFVDAGPTAPESEVVVTVRVNDIWQGALRASAFFVGTGFPESNTISQAIALGDGVPGQLVAHRFVDLNGNGTLDAEDFGMDCDVYVYTAGITAQRIPNDVASPADPRLPLVTFGRTDETSTARINLLPGRYAVYYSGCQARNAPVSFNPVDIIADPPVTKVHDVSGANTWDVQLVAIATTQMTDVLYLDKPAGPLAPPTGLRLDGLILSWTDNATDETGYRVQIDSTAGGASGTFDLPANSATFTIPSSLLTPCGHTALQVSVAPVDANGGVGYPAHTNVDSIADCAGPVIAPNTGDGASATTGSSWPLALAAGVAVLAGVALTRGALLKRR